MLLIVGVLEGVEKPYSGGQLIGAVAEESLGFVQRASGGRDQEFRVLQLGQLRLQLSVPLLLFVPGCGVSVQGAGLGDRRGVAVVHMTQASVLPARLRVCRVAQATHSALAQGERGIQDCRYGHTQTAAKAAAFKLPPAGLRPSLRIRSSRLRMPGQGLFACARGRLTQRALARLLAPWRPMSVGGARKRTRSGLRLPQR